MKASKLAKAAWMVGACRAGIENLESYETVQEWWEKTRHAGYLTYLWLLVVFAYPKEKTLQTDVAEMVRFINDGYPFFVAELRDVLKDYLDPKGLTLRAAMNCLAADTVRFANVDEYRKVYRRPTEIELRKVVKMINKECAENLT